jgi:hypothetical protein
MREMVRLCAILRNCYLCLAVRTCSLNNLLAGSQYQPLVRQMRQLKRLENK